MVVDPDHFVVSHLSEVLNAGCLSGRRWTFEYYCKVAHSDHASELSKQAFERLSQDEVLLVEVLWWMLSFLNDITFNVDIAIVFALF